MFPYISRELRAFVIADIFGDPKEAEKQKANLDLENRLVQSVSQPYYVVIDPRSERVLREWGFRKGQTAVGFKAQLSAALRAFRLLNGGGQKPK